MSNYQRPPETGPGLRLHLNENTGGCSPAVLEALRALSAEDISFYPGYADVERETAAHLGVDPAWLLLVNGLDEGLHLVSALALRPDADGPKRSVIPEPAFEMYAACTAASGGDAVRIRPRRDFEFPLDDIRAALDARTTLLYLTNPNNPTGLTVPPETFASLAAEAPHVTVLVDEAYIDFGGDTCLSHLDAHRNLIVGRTFAKAYGLAALRAGCLIAHPDTLAPLRAMAPPFSLNVAAAVALRAALRDRDWHQNYVQQSHTSRQMIYEFCEARGIEHYVSAANFVLVRLGDDAARAVQGLADRGIFVRDRSTQPGCAGCIRITAGIAEHTARCLAALEEIL
jgi:histidinol-phosphate aminotransferase